MKRYILTLASILMLCSSCNYSREEVRELNKEAEKLESSIKERTRIIKGIDDDVRSLEERKHNIETELSIIEAGNTPRYYIEIRSNTYKYTPTIIWIETTEEFFYRYDINDDIPSDDGCDATVIEKKIRS